MELSSGKGRCLEEINQAADIFAINRNQVLLCGGLVDVQNVNVAGAIQTPDSLADGTGANVSTPVGADQLPLSALAGFNGETSFQHKGGQLFGHEDRSDIGGQIVTLAINDLQSRIAIVLGPGTIVAGHLVGILGGNFFPTDVHRELPVSGTLDGVQPDVLVIDHFDSAICPQKCGNISDGPCVHTVLTNLTHFLVDGEGLAGTDSSLYIGVVSHGVNLRLNVSD